MMPATEILTVAVGSFGVAGVVYGVVKHFARQELVIKSLEDADGIPSCNRILICPHAPDFKELKSSVKFVEISVAELKGTVNGISNTVEFIGKHLSRNAD